MPKRTEETIAILILAIVAAILVFACIPMGVVSMSVVYWDIIYSVSDYYNYGLFYYQGAANTSGRILLSPIGLTGRDALITNLRNCQIAFQIMAMIFALIAVLTFLVIIIFWCFMKSRRPNRLGGYFLPRCLLVCGILAAFGAFLYFISFVFYHNYKSVEYMNQLYGANNTIPDLAYRFNVTITYRRYGSMYFLAWGSFGAELIGAILFFIISCSCFGVEECGRYIFYRRLYNPGATKLNKYDNKIPETWVSKKPIFEYESPIYTSSVIPNNLNISQYKEPEYYSAANLH